MLKRRVTLPDYLNATRSNLLFKLDFDTEGKDRARTKLHLLAVASLLPFSAGMLSFINRVMTIVL